MKFSTIIKTFGYVLLVAGVGLVAIGYIGIVISDGFGALLDIISPLNIWNYISVAVTLAPGILLLMWSKKIEEKHNKLSK